MNRLWCSIVVCLAATHALLGVRAADPTTSSVVNGGMVDADVPATYRLPVVPPAVVTSESEPLPLFPAPTSSAADPPIRVASRAQTFFAPSPAGSPPDEGREDECHGGSGGPPVEQMPVAPQAAGPAEAAEPVAMDVAPLPQATTELTSQLLPAVQRGFGLAQRGAVFAARTEFIQVLRRVAQARDVALKTDENAKALAAGLRAIDEAEDFVPDGVQLEAELDVRVAASSHRTRVLPDGPERISPFDAAGLYHDFATEQLAKAASGEQVGSMALYGLGKVYARLAERGDDDVKFGRSATTMYSAAVAARADNHMAANELGVLYCRAGRSTEAVRLFERTIDSAPTAVAYHNLAMAQRKLGLIQQAAANEQESARLAAWERARGDVSRRAGVRWVTPNEMARVAQPAPWSPATANRPVSQPAPKSAWQRAVDLGKKVALPGAGNADHGLGPASETRIAHPMGPGPSPSQWR